MCRKNIKLKFWNNQEIKFLKKNYKKFSYKKIGKLLGRSKGGIQNKCKHLQLNKTKPVKIGEKFGRLIVIKESPKRINRSKYYFCKCECGKIKEIIGYSLRYGNTKSCGCLFKYINQKAPGMVTWLKFYRVYKKSAKTHNREFSLTFNEFVNICSKNCNYCGIKPRKTNAYYKKDNTRSPYSKGVTEISMKRAWILFNGIDRINNNLGYILKNSTPCCSDCNFAKKQMSKKQFFEWVKRVMYHNKLCAEKVPY